MAHELPKLPYAPDALEPHVDARTMDIHHGKHHAAYVANLNAALDRHPELHGRGLEDLLRNLAAVPEDIRAAVRNNGGGHYNHSLFWTWLTPRGGAPKAELARALDAAFGSVDTFKAEFQKTGLSRFGSGWVWLTVREGKLCVCSTPNQDAPIMTGVAECPGEPILGVDVWEHAYYLKYQNRRADYLAAWWNVVNWEQVGERYAAAKAGTLTV